VASLIQWIRRSFITGFFVTVPLVISVFAFVWIFRLIDGFVGPLYEGWLERYLPGVHIPGLGIVTTALVVLLVGAVASNVLGKRLLQRAESYLVRVPVFRTIYSPVKQLVVAFSPDNEYGFKRVVLVEDSARGFLLGFLTREFTVDRGSGRKRCWRSTCPPTTSIWATCSSVRWTRPPFPTSPWSRRSASS
jgi:uncharacterized membrane protein